METGSSSQRLERAVPWLLALLYVVYSLGFYDRGLDTFDEGILLYGAERILGGEVPHRDFLLIVNSGAFYLLAGLFAVFGKSILVSRVAALAVGAAICALLYRLGRRTAGPWPSAAAALCFTFWATNQFNIFWYTSLGTLCVLLTLLALERHYRRGGRLPLVFAGVIAASGYVVKQNIGAVLVASAATALLANAVVARRVREGLVDCAAFGLGAVVVLLACLALLAGGGVLDDWYLNTVTALVRHAHNRLDVDPLRVGLMLPVALVLAGDVALLFVANLPALWRGGTARRRAAVAAAFLGLAALHCAVPRLVESAMVVKTLYLQGGPFELFVALGSEVVARAVPVLLIVGGAAVVAADLRAKRPDPVYLAYLVVVVTCFYVAIVIYPDLPHLITASGSLWLLLPRLAERSADLASLLGRWLRILPTLPERRVGALALLVVVVAVALTGDVVARDAYTMLYAHARPVREDVYALEARRGRGILTDPEQGRAVDGVVAFIRERTAEGEPVLFFPSDATLYFLSGRPNPTFFNSYWWDAYIPGLFPDAIRALDEKGVRYVCVRVGDERADRYDMFLAYDAAAEPIVAHIRAHFTPEARFGPYVVLRRGDR